MSCNLLNHQSEKKKLWDAITRNWRTTTIPVCCAFIVLFLLFTLRGPWLCVRRDQLCFCDVTPFTTKPRELCVVATYLRTLLRRQTDKDETRSSTVALRSSSLFYKKQRSFFLLLEKTISSLHINCVIMPFYAKDWRSPGESWIKTQDGWEKLKILECRQNSIDSSNFNRLVLTLSLKYFKECIFSTSNTCRLENESERDRSFFKTGNEQVNPSQLLYLKK